MSQVQRRVVIVPRAREYVANPSFARNGQRLTGAKQTRGRPAKAVTSKVIASKVVKKVGKVEASSSPSPLPIDASLTYV